jgi:hypothetical protein
MPDRAGRAAKSSGAGHEITSHPLLGPDGQLKRLVLRHLPWVTGDEASFFRCDREISENVEKP